MKEEEIHYWGTTPEKEYYKKQGILASKSTFTSPRGLSLFTRSWLPKSTMRPHGVICMVHGYSNDISWTFQSTAIFLAQQGFACFAVDIEGHGGTEGLKAHVPNMDLVVLDCLSFFTFVKREPFFSGLPCFLYGESMGGAICLMIHFACPHDFDGAVLIAPMCRIADKMRPPWPIPQVLYFLAKLMPTLAIIPTGDVVDKSIKIEEKKKIGFMNPFRYTGKPRLATAMEFLRMSDCIGKRLGDVTIPFVVLHGSADVVTDPNVSIDLHREAKSKDKTLKIYEGMMHSLLFGEPEENIAMVRSDILSWLRFRCQIMTL